MGGGGWIGDMFAGGGWTLPEWPKPSIDYLLPDTWGTLPGCWTTKISKHSSCEVETINYGYNHNVDRFVFIQWVNQIFIWFFSVSPAPDQGTNNWYPNRLDVTTNVAKFPTNLNLQGKLKNLQSGIYNRQTVTFPGTENERNYWISSNKGQAIWQVNNKWRIGLVKDLRTDTCIVGIIFWLHFQNYKIDCGFHSHGLLGSDPHISRILMSSTIYGRFLA